MITHYTGRTTRFAALAAVAAGALALAACSSSGGGGGNNANKGSNSRTNTVIIAENEVPASFDPIQADNSTVDEVTLPAYDTLVKYDDSGKIVGDLASQFSVGNGGKSVSITLHPNVTFHDGTKLTSNDVKYTLDRDKKINIGVAAFLTAYTSTTVTDDTHLTINLSTPSGPFLGSLSRIYIVNAALVQKNAGSDDGQKWLSSHDAGSGPYMLKGYTPNQEADFTKYAKYWQGWSGQADAVQFKYMTDAATERSSLLNNDVDLAMDIDPNDWASFSSNSNYVVKKSPTNVVLYVFFKMAGGITANKDLREAIAYAYNYPQHVTNILKGAGQKVVGPLPSGMQCYDPNVTQPTYDPAKAKQLLAASGLKNVSVTLTYLKATAEMEQAAALLQSNLKAIGVTLKLKAITYPEYAELAKSNKTTPDLGMIYAFPAIPDPDAIMYQNFDSKFINGGQNWGGYKNATVDHLVEQAQQLTNLDDRCKLYNQAESIVTNDFPTINMANSKYVTIYNKRLSGYTYEASHHQTVDVYRIKVG
jgi:peptide/nickel transport system substrate-binding protein